MISLSYWCLLLDFGVCLIYIEFYFLEFFFSYVIVLLLCFILIGGVLKIFIVIFWEVIGNFEGKFNRNYEVINIGIIFLMGGR